MEKRGSHVGMILSFVIFVIFLVFVITTLQPAVKTQNEKSSLMEYLKAEIIKNTTGKMNQTTVKIETNPGGGNAGSCIEWTNELENIPEEDIIVKNKTKAILEWDRRNNKMSLDIPSDSISSPSFFEIYSSEDFESQSTGLNGCRGVSAEIVTFREHEYPFEKRIIKMFEDYENDYSALKKSLKIPAGTEFNVSFKRSDGIEIHEFENQIKTNVYVEEVSIRYINQSAEINSGFIKVAVW